ncbi:very short patch repair endonuclease [Massilia suwonensis]|uniref:Very short patch repair endonuclease n=1 Tax=Massilia suwonensis TaxID=648895 RepID=A0ABW0MTU3_9BURK
MGDTVTSAQRSENMKRIRSANTRPELTIRRMIYRLGYRYRIHVKKLPGTPDIVFSSKRKIIFVHGCFWHFHQNCRAGRIPNSKVTYWHPKLMRTRARDEAHLEKLASLGWKVLVIWECELKDTSEVELKIQKFLE